MGLQFKELEPYTLQVTGELEMCSEYYKHIIVDGEKYTKLVREYELYNYDELYAKGELNLKTLDVFTPLFGKPLKIYYLQQSDFSHICRWSIQSEYGKMLRAICDFYNIKSSWGKGWNLISDCNLRASEIPYIVDRYAGCSFCVYLPFQKVIELNLVDKIYEEIKGSLRYTDRVKKLFLPITNDFQKVERLIDFNNLRFDLIGNEDDLL